MQKIFILLIFFITFCKSVVWSANRSPINDQQIYYIELYPKDSASSQQIETKKEAAPSLAEEYSSEMGRGNEENPFGDIASTLKPQGKEGTEIESDCAPTPKSMRIDARYIEGRGVGYSKGYGTLEAFFAPPPDLLLVMPFIDLRGHLFSNRKWAANGGIGARALLKDRVYGAAAYYDYRNTNKKNYNQISFGLETLGTLWDLRLNGYFVLGKTISSGYDPTFTRLSGNHIYYSQKFEYALSGGNAEIGFHVLDFQGVKLYTAAGPYYLNGPLGTGVFGGQARLRGSWKDIVSLELSYSYDHLYSNIVQGQVGLTFAFGPRLKGKNPNNYSCSKRAALYDCMVEPFVKSEIIPVSVETQSKLAINPATGQPYTVLFVNNLSHCSGTFESPYATLIDAQNASKPHDIIYVYPGDLTSSGLSSGIVLKPGQKLLGATLHHPLLTTDGPITLTAQNDGPFHPIISNTSGPVITAASDNLIAGFYIQNIAGPGVLASDITHLQLSHNAIQANTSNYNGIELNNVSGNVVISNNSILNQKKSISINNSAPISNAYYFISDSLIHAAGNDSNIHASFTEGTNNHLALVNNIIFSDGVSTSAPAINIEVSNMGQGGANTFILTRNNIQSHLGCPVNLTLNKNANCHISFLHNNLNASSQHVLSLSAHDSSNSVVNIINNSLLFSNSYGVFVEAHSNATSVLNVNGNILHLPYSIDNNVLHYSSVNHSPRSPIEATATEAGNPSDQGGIKGNGSPSMSSSTAISGEAGAINEPSAGKNGILPHLENLPKQCAINIKVYNTQQRTGSIPLPIDPSNLPLNQGIKTYVLPPCNTDPDFLRNLLLNPPAKPIYKIIPIEPPKKRKDS